MKLKAGFVTQDIDDTQFLIPIGKENENNHGMLRSNATAAMIINYLKKDTCSEKIVDAIYEEYNADRETIEKDVNSVLEVLRSVNALEEP